MGTLSQSLAFKQAFSNLKLETSARVKLDEAAAAYDKRELAKSAELFLESWRILRGEYESGLYKQHDYKLPFEKQKWPSEKQTRETKERMLLSLVALHDLAIACSCINEEYKDKSGKCKLDVYALRYGWGGNTTTEELEIEAENDEKNNRKWPQGSGIAHVLLLKDPFGRMLETAESFREAAYSVATFCYSQLDMLDITVEGFFFIRDSLQLMQCDLYDQLYRGKVGARTKELSMRRSGD